MYKRPKALSKKSIEDCVRKANKAQRKIMSNNIQENMDWERPIVSIYITPEELDRINSTLAVISQIAEKGEKPLEIRAEGKINYHSYEELLKAQREQMIKVIEKRIVMKLPAFPPKNKNIINNIKKLKLFSIKDLEELLKELKKDE